MDEWHKILLGAVTALVGAVVAMWRDSRKQSDQARVDMQAMHESTTKLGYAVVEQLARRSPPPASGSRRSPPE